MTSSHLTAQAPEASIAVGSGVRPEWAQQLGDTNRKRLKLEAAAPDLYAFAKALDASWTEAFPNGPDGDCSLLGGIGQLHEEHAALWRLCRAALTAASPDEASS